MKRGFIKSVLKSTYWYAGQIGMMIEVEDNPRAFASGEMSYSLLYSRYNINTFKERGLSKHHSPGSCLIGVEDITFDLVNEELEGCLRPLSELE